MHADGDRLNDLSGQATGCAFTVLNTLGAGFLEKVYENALAHELRTAGITVAQQSGVPVEYTDVLVGAYVVDRLFADVLLVALKTATRWTGRIGCNAPAISRRPPATSTFRPRVMAWLVPAMTGTRERRRLISKRPGCISACC